MLERYPQEVKLVFKHFPLESHKFAVEAALAATAAQQDKKFWEVHDLLFKNYKKLNKAKIKEIVGQAGFDEKAFSKRMQAPDTMARVRKDYNDGIEAGVRGTPTVFINGRKLKSRSLGKISALIDKELDSSNPRDPNK